MALFNKKQTVGSKNQTATAPVNLVIQRPLFTEKAFRAHEKNQYAFIVAPKATKSEVKKAVERIYNVSVLRVSMIRQKGSTRYFKGARTNGPIVKKAYVSIPEGQKIDMGAQA